MSKQPKGKKPLPGSAALSGTRASKRGNEERAQELFYDAMEASTEDQCLELLRQVLELDPKNVDALLVIADAADPGSEERIGMLREIVAIAAGRLGKKAFKELVPHFWGFIETRPYMRARQALAEDLRLAGKLAEAADEYAQMLVLNEGDNQGVRYELLPMLLALGRLEEARELMERYEEDCDWNVVFSWGRVLERWLSKDAEGAKASLAAARKQNPHVEPYLTGRKKEPKRIPAGYSPGSKEEAVCFAEVLILAWSAYPKAGAWLSKEPK